MINLSQNGYENYCLLIDNWMLVTQWIYQIPSVLVGFGIEVWLLIYLPTILIYDQFCSPKVSRPIVVRHVKHTPMTHDTKLLKWTLIFLKQNQKI